ncbi:hypothetical protein FAM09_04490 [Niastella caeni]|uniref:DUF4488 domain-containing protein n=1 Tax=Niastella caeni TaxID=2569763 RepID=A0A4S8I4C0_9BACT|nr:hypothetical protein [Niastella caeni]THU41372.1 hypothetical protein FAM09_04490 [Niastella caeni]
MKTCIALLLSLMLCGILPVLTHAQTITGAWKGKIGSAHTELKLIKKGDSLLGTSYYYTSRSNYIRYAVKGYFDPNSNSVIWWDEAMLEDRLSGKMFGDKEALLSVADFNCPGEKTMMLDGESTERDNKNKPKGTVALQKITSSGFHDEWDFVIENYIYGANDPEIIDSIARLHLVTNEVTEEKESSLESTTIKPVAKNNSSIAVTGPPIVEKKKPTPTPTTTAQQKFTSREKKLATVIPIIGDSIELRFYDNAVVDGDSIAVFMNDKMVFEHVRLNNKPYTLTLSVNDLSEDNEMVMVAENLGTIPPNTSLMVAIVDGKRYEARLESTENSSALIRFIKQKKKASR